MVLNKKGRAELERMKKSVRDQFISQETVFIPSGINW